jgi:hypothetical protein
LGAGQLAPGQEAGRPLPPTRSAPIQTGNLTDDIEQVLWWLPQDTEAVVVSKGNVPIKALQSAPPPTVTFGATSTPTPPPECSYKYQDLVAMNCIEPLVHQTGLCHDDLYNKVLKSFYGPHTASLFVKAVWWEKDETRASCDIVVFQDDTAARIVKSFAALRNVAREFHGLRVIEVDLNTNFTPERYFQYFGRPLKPDLRYLAAPRPNVYFAATNARLMEVLIERIKQRGKSRALPADLPEWQKFDPTVPAWGVRHYRPAVANKDLTSMLKRDPNAGGLVFFGGNRPAQFLCLRYVSKSEDAGSRFLRLKADYLNIKDSTALWPMQRISADCVESRLRPKAALAEAMREKEEGSWWTGELIFHCIDTLYLPFLGFAWPEDMIFATQ